MEYAYIYFPEAFLSLFYMGYTCAPQLTRLELKISLGFNWTSRHEGVLVSGGIAPRILQWLALSNDIRWRIQIKKDLTV
jgi:hypothetical protein